MPQTSPPPPRKRLTAWLLVLLFGMAFAAPAGAAPASSLPSLLTTARTRNPELQAARLRYEAAQARAGYAGTLQPPKLNLSLMQLWGLEGPSAAVSQMIPLGQKRSLESTMASRDAEMARGEYEAKWLTIASDVKQAYYDLIYQEKALAIHHATREQVKNLQKVANARYAVGAGPQQDSLRAQVELSKLYDSEFEISQRIQSTRNKLNTLLNRGLDEPIPLPADFPKEPRPPVASELLAQAERNHPMILAAQASVAAAEARAAMAAEERQVPDLEVGLQVGKTMPEGMASAGNTYLGGMVGVTLPWLTPARNEGRILEAQQSVAAAQASYESQLSNLRYRVRDLRNQLHRTTHRLELYRTGFFLQANQSLKGALAAYQVNKADFSTVIEAQMAVFDTQMGYAMAQSEYFKLLAMLESELNLADPESKSREK
ncbi:MAG TPA: TolC family protein [Stenomitos sp.]